jgi:ubiquinone/menaquinone biosynthesis C-methylase UbiE
MTVSRLVLSRILNLIFQRGLSLPVADVSSGYRLYAASVLRGLPLSATGYEILEEILIRVLLDGYRVHEVPFRYRGHGLAASRRRLLPFGLAALRTLGAMWRLRNSIAAADYDARAYNSVVPLQRAWQRRRHAVVTRRAAGFEAILDVGCGSSQILRADPGIVGLDIQLHKLRYSRRFGNPLVHGSIFELPFADSSFDCVICSEVIEHIPAGDKPFHELTRVLKPGGRLILGTPDYGRWSWRALEWCYARAAPGGYADEHITHYARAPLRRLLERTGLEIEAIEYVFASEVIFSCRKRGPADDDRLTQRPRD